MVVAAVLVAALTGCGSEEAPAPDQQAERQTTVSSSESALPVVSLPAASSPVSRRPMPPSLPPPYIERVAWAQTEVGPSLQIYPTRAGREVSGDTVAESAWREVLALAPDGDTPGMRAQFDCHWTFARLVDPEKPSWNLEPARPVVSPNEMVASRCNPGFDEEN
ncbi:hypothetical protein GOHSU_14_00480 [Gordonia hirsuta DSM 44140 = NBRC 16056]|uniref:DUF2599 domain-containing protein n=1 Tax=Gordonia hirsuta DSM 44140 = NBRC 16056 TaxID=1121927 RepID=L7L805_9ACTN|nr:DUF2599 domain-containing protein [Gordonia hirsuta]GAC56881.1 hypothetical protein GOHSU_14_00480 [Gordonia hirsuta DSM 44140 = NBRC 16056]